MTLRLATLAAFLLVPVSLAAQTPSPAISFEAEAVVASGVTAGGRVVWFSMAREISESAATIVRREEILEDEDGDGAVRFELDRAVPLRSIWVAVDLATGAWAAAGPEGYPLQRVDPPGLAARRGAEGAHWVEDTRGYVELLVVRPGVGAWGLAVGDGGASDADGAADGRLTVPLDRLRGTRPEATAAPERFDPQDLIFVIDPNEMDFAVRQLAEVAR
jgi:hypothetical protein